MSSLLITGSAYLPPLPNPNLNLHARLSGAGLNSARPNTGNSAGPAVTPDATHLPARLPPANILAYNPDFGLLQRQILKGGPEGARALKELAGLLRRGAPGAAEALKDLIVTGFKTFGRNPRALKRFLVPIVRSLGKVAVARALPAAAATLGGVSFAALTVALAGIAVTPEGFSDGTLNGKGIEPRRNLPVPERKTERIGGLRNPLAPRSKDSKIVRSAMNGDVRISSNGTQDICVGKMHVKASIDGNNKMKGTATVEVTAYRWDMAKGGYVKNDQAIVYANARTSMVDRVDGDVMFKGESQSLSGYVAGPQGGGYNRGHVEVVVSANVNPLSPKQIASKYPAVDPNHMDPYSTDQIPPNKLNYSQVTGTNRQWYVDGQPTLRATACVVKDALNPKNLIAIPADFTDLRSLSQQNLWVTQVTGGGRLFRVNPTPPGQSPPIRY